jgi:hypothetical protein
MSAAGKQPKTRNALHFFAYELLTVASLALTGCAQSWVYTAPPNLTPQTAATIKGSDFGALQVYLSQIDGKNVVGGWNNINSYKLGWQPWEGIYLLAPGKHDIIVGVQCCTEAEFNFVHISMNFVAGATYILNATTPEAQSDGTLKTAVILKSDTGMFLSSQAPVTLKVNPSADPFVVPFLVK